MKSPIRFLFSLSVAAFTILLLTIVQLKVENPLLLAERFAQNTGWIEILFIGLYGAIVAWKMVDPKKVPRWRIITWNIFSIVFFSQLILGILFNEKFLMTGKLHLPIPAMILSGPLYRGQISIMTVLFLGTIVLTGPSWCSQLCYFGAIDGNFARLKSHRGKISHKMRFKHSLVLAVIIVTLLLRLFSVNTVVSTILGILFGVGGVVVIIVWSRKKGKMIHCILYCPIGTVVNYLKYVNPFRMYIDSSCSFCGSCSQVCRYDALTLNDLSRKKPGITCTYCGDCLSACQISSIHYKIFGLNPEISRRLYLFLTISIHAVFLALARI
jgi:ferredoxin-type protein NapH